MTPIVQLQPQPSREPSRRPLLHVVDGQSSQPVATPATLRRARPDDVEPMFRLLDEFARRGLLLPRRIQDVYRNVREFIVAADQNDQVVGCGGLRIYTPVLAEVVALAVDERCHGHGIGRQIVESLLADARALDICRVFAMTLQPVFFQRLGFEPTQVALFPEKIAIDCSGCAKRATCQEITMVLDL
ncbi:MAG TPA: GNAT family N-acetyltransferase [Longimicrobiales bacterium]|nr:GNAT family N-acetyltransferase [Longimicrobiales bacterium]